MSYTSSSYAKLLNIILYNFINTNAIGHIILYQQLMKIAYVKCDVCKRKKILISLIHREKICNSIIILSEICQLLLLALLFGWYIAKSIYFPTSVNLYAIYIPGIYRECVTPVARVVLTGILYTNFQKSMCMQVDFNASIKFITLIQ